MDKWQMTVYEKMKTFAESRVIIAHEQQKQEPCEPVLIAVTQEEAYVIMTAMEKLYPDARKLLNERPSDAS